MGNFNKLNFSGGPGALPAKVLKELQQAIIKIPKKNLSLLGINHRDPWFAEVISEAEANILRLLNLSDKPYRVLFLPGGATQQFSMIPLNFLTGLSNPVADYLVTGYWSQKAVDQVRLTVSPIKIHLAWNELDCKKLPSDDQLDLTPSGKYLHYVSNETVEGTQFNRIVGKDIREIVRICDMSSDFLSRPVEADKFSLIYAHAQKNLGASGVTIVLINTEYLKENRVRDQILPGFLDYEAQLAASSIFNTPPVFSIYSVLLVTRWLLNDIGGLDRMGEINQTKANLLYSAIDNSNGFYKNIIFKPDRSIINISFNLPNSNLENKFLNEAEATGLIGLKGHRSYGGIRASLYNGMTVSSVKTLVKFMKKFKISWQSRF